jgi:hypothetical protein
MEDEKYIKGFNDGYILSKYKSPLANSIFKTIERKDDYSQGLFEGIETQEREMIDGSIKEFRNIRNDNDWEIDR